MIDPGRSLSYNITIQCSLDGFCFVVHDLEENKIVDIELYQTSETGDESLIMEALGKTVFKKGLYQKPVHSVRYIVGNRLNTLIPNELFDERELESYLRFSHELPKGQILLFDRLPELDSVNVFAMSAIQETNLHELWDDVAYVNVNSRTFDLAVVSESKLRFFNNFKFNTKDDFIYFLMFALEQQQLSGQEVPVYFSGLITGNSEIIKLCERYIKRIHFINPDGSVEVDLALSDTPFQYYYIPYKSLS